MASAFFSSSKKKKMTGKKRRTAKGFHPLESPILGKGKYQASPICNNRRRKGDNRKQPGNAGPIGRLRPGPTDR
jgi:hypothetical protein